MFENVQLVNLPNKKDEFTKWNSPQILQSIKDNSLAFILSKAKYS
jgi:hypothetical protein